jgi:hypothetical protein
MNETLQLEQIESTTAAYRLLSAAAQLFVSSNEAQQPRTAVD